jgi:hypothetical protein
MQMGERPALQQCQENDRLQPPGSNSLTFATKSVTNSLPGRGPRWQLHPNLRTFKENAAAAESGQELPHAVQQGARRRVSKTDDLAPIRSGDRPDMKL